MPPDAPIVNIDDNDRVRGSMRALLEAAKFPVRDFPSALAFLADTSVHACACLIVDVRMPGMSGLELQAELARRNLHLPLIVVTGYADVQLAVQAMKAGARDFLEKPFDGDALLTSVRRVIAVTAGIQTETAEAGQAARLIERLTDREREVLRHLTLGETNKLIAHNLGISPRTVENHRAHLQAKLKARGLSDLVRIVRLAGQFS